MGVDEHRKAEVYLEISHAATLRDASYWLQVVFAAGIATLGLVLNSPAVIIGAMLISANGPHPLLRAFPSNWGFCPAG